MKHIQWKPEFSVGVDSLDKQHQQIIDVINRLIEDPGLFDDFDSLNDVLMQLTSYVSQHFLLEEQLLEKFGYQDIVGHSQKHTAYAEKVTQHCLNALHQKENPEKLLTFLSDWWINHILHEDMQYKSLLEDKNIP